jgi:hypothetical protein
MEVKGPRARREFRARCCCGRSHSNALIQEG